MTSEIVVDSRDLNEIAQKGIQRKLRQQVQIIEGLSMQYGLTKSVFCQVCFCSTRMSCQSIPYPFSWGTSPTRLCSGAQNIRRCWEPVPCSYRIKGRIEYQPYILRCGMVELAVGFEIMFHAGRSYPYRRVSNVNGPGISTIARYPLKKQPQLNWMLDSTGCTLKRFTSITVTPHPVQCAKYAVRRRKG